MIWYKRMFSNLGLLTPNASSLPTPPFHFHLPPPLPPGDRHQGPGDPASNPTKRRVAGAGAGAGGEGGRRRVPSRRLLHPLVSALSSERDQKTDPRHPAPRGCDRSRESSPFPRDATGSQSTYHRVAVADTRYRVVARDADGGGRCH